MKALLFFAVLQAAFIGALLDEATIQLDGPHANDCSTAIPGEIMLE